MRATIYTRVSSDPRDQRRSVAEQETECRQFCEREGWDVVRVFSDNDRSASRHATKSRPDYGKLREHIAAGRTDVLVMWEGSRATRDLADFAALSDLCRDKGVLYAYSGKIFDPSRTDDRFTTGLDALMAERESSTTRDRLMRAQRAMVAAGMPHGPLLYGYRREYGSGGTLVAQLVDEAHASIVRWVADRVASGESCRSISMDLNARGVPAPRGPLWNPSTISRMVINPGYIGMRVARGKVVGPAAWPAILAEDVHAECRAVVTDPQRRTNLAGAGVKYLLSGIALCGCCGKPLKTIKGRSGGRATDYRQYWCRESGCHKVGIKQPTLDDFVERIVLARLALPDVVEAMGRADVERSGHADTARARVAELRARLDGFYGQAADGSISPAGLAHVESKLLAEIDAAEREVFTVSMPAAVRELTGEDAAARWAAMSMPDRREVVRILATIYVDPVGRGHRVFNPERVRVEWNG